MDGGYIRALTELTQKFLNKDVNINKFHGYENEDINCWLEKLELVLDSKGIRLDVPAARTQLINNLAGPVETFNLCLNWHQTSVETIPETITL